MGRTDSIRVWSTGLQLHCFFKISYGLRVWFPRSEKAQLATQKNICVEGGGYAVKILLNEYKAIIDAEE
jgi:hypothetical protein